MTTPKTGQVTQIAPLVRRIIAPNPSPMTYWGTNTFLSGQRDVTVIDPGPASEPHLDAIMQAVGAGRVSQIVVTHSHLDHSPLADVLRQKTGTPVLGFGDSHAGRSDVMRMLASNGLAGGGEGVDTVFSPDHCLADGDTIGTEAGDLHVLHTPGHMGNHIALVLGSAAFTGDLVMDWASSLVSPPDGDLDDFLRSCDRLRALNLRVLYPAHGNEITDPTARLTWLIDHRKARTQQVLDALQQGAQSATQLANAIYQETPPSLMPAATRNVFAHLVSLTQAGHVTAFPDLGSDAVFSLSDEQQEM